MVLRLGVMTAICATMFVATPARADDGVVVVVESNHAGTRPARLRAQIARAGLVVVEIGDDDARRTPETLTIVVHASGESATVRLRGERTLDASFRRGARRDANWLAHDVAHLVQSARRRAAQPGVDASEVLDPWANRRADARPPAPTPTRVPQSEVLDPWNGQRAAPRPPAPAQVYVEDEVLDPWGRRPAPEPPVVHVEVLDPWARDEPASELSAPRPRR